MKYRFLTLAVTLAATLNAATAQAQSLFPLQQQEILGNNRTLLSAAQSSESEKLDNLSGLTLANPEASVSYMFGSPSDVPNKTNIEVSQTFDFPTLSGARRSVAEASNKAVDAAYLTQRSELALEVENALVEYLYQRSLVSELEKYVANRREILTIAKQSLDKGVITYLEYNDIELANLAAENELAQAQLELSAAGTDLARLNSGTMPSSLPGAWPEMQLPSSFDEWLAIAAPVAPELLSLHAEIEQASREVNLRKKEGLPEFSVGYVNELVKDGNYHGASIGLSLPLWGNKGRVKAAKAKHLAAQINAEAASEQFALTKRAEYDKAKLLMEVADKYDKAYAQSLTETNKYLDLAYEKRTMNILDYRVAKAAQYEYAVKCLDARRAFFQARSALYAPIL